MLERGVHLISVCTQDTSPVFAAAAAPTEPSNCNVTLNMKMLISDGTSLPQCRQVSCPFLLLSHLISSNFPSSSLPLVPSLLIPPLIHRCLRSAQQFGTFRATVLHFFYRLGAIIYHFRVAHNVHTHIHTHHHHRESLTLSIWDVEESWTV